MCMTRARARTRGRSSLGPACMGRCEAHDIRLAVQMYKTIDVKDPKTGMEKKASHTKSG
jgi:hypothetical protein